MTRAALALVACAGCSQLFGLESPSRGTPASDGAVDDIGVEDVLSDVAAPLPRKRRFDIDGSKVVGGPHANFPVLVDITASWLRPASLGGDVADEDGLDIYFSADVSGSSRIDFETEHYGIDGRYVGWLRIPNLSTSSFFYIHYGDPSITQSQENVPEVWFSGYVMVTHLNGPATDSLGVSTLASTSTNVSTGQFGDALTFNGADSQVNAGSDADNAFDGGGTIEAWVRPTGFGESSWGRVVDKGADNGWILYMNDNNHNDSFSFAFGSNNATYGQWTSPPNSISLNTWQHIAAVFDRNASSNTPLLYVNGVSVSVTQHSTPSGGFDNDAARTMYIGNTEGGDRAYAGQIDEVRLSNDMRPPGWLATQYANQSSPSTFYTISGPL